MSNVLEYKGYYTRVEYSVEDNILFGKIEDIRDLVNWDAKSTDEIEFSFHQAVDDYLDFCKELGRQPDLTRNSDTSAYLLGTLHSINKNPPFVVGDEDYTGYLIVDNEGYFHVADYTYDKYPYDHRPWFHVDGEYQPGVKYWALLPKLPEDLK